MKCLRRLMNWNRSAARVAISLVVALSMGQGRAELVTLDTTLHPINILTVPPQSRLSMQIDLFGGQQLTFSNIAVSGTVPVDFALNYAESGLVEADNSIGGSLFLANATQSFPGVVLRGSVQTIEVTAKLIMGPESVVNENLLIDNSTPGSFTLDNGILRFTFTGGAFYTELTNALGTNVFDVNLSINPIEFQFANLGTIVVVGTTDDDNNGLDFDGAELNLPLTGLAFTDWLGVTTRITSSGNLYLGSNVILPGIPELNSFGLVSLAAAGMAGAMAARRRMLRKGTGSNP